MAQPPSTPPDYDGDSEPPSPDDFADEQPTRIGEVSAELLAQASSFADADDFADEQPTQMREVSHELLAEAGAISSFPDAIASEFVPEEEDDDDFGLVPPSVPPDSAESWSTNPPMPPAPGMPGDDYAGDRGLQYDPGATPFSEHPSAARRSGGGVGRTIGFVLLLVVLVAGGAIGAHYYTHGTLPDFQAIFASLTG